MDMMYLARGGSVLGAGQIVSSGAAFILSIAFANLFPKETFGVYRYALSLVGIAGAFALTGLETALTQSVARGFDSSFPRGVKITFFSSFCTSAALLAIAGYYFLHHNSLIGWGLIIAAVATPLLKTSGLFGAFLVGKKDFSRRTKYGIFYDITSAAGIIIALLFTDSAFVLLGVYFFITAMMSFLLYRRTLTVYKPLTHPEDPTLLPNSLHLSVMGFLGMITSQLDRILTFHYLGASSLAVYSFALAIPQHLRQGQKIISTLVLPRFSQHRIEHIQKNIFTKAFGLFIVMALVAGVYILAAPFIFKLLFPDYIESIAYSQVFALILLFSPSVLYQQTLIAHQQQKALYILNFVGAPLRIITLLILTPLYGIWGVLTSTFINEIFRLVLVIYFVHQISEPKDPDRLSTEAPTSSSS